MSRWSTSQVAGVIRFIVLPTLGAIGVGHEMFFWTGETREAILLICGAMMGVPLPSLADWFKEKAKGDKDQTGQEREPSA